MIEAADLSLYPPLARALAMEHLPLLRKLPAVFGALLMSEMVGYDWRFPAERAEIERQIIFLGAKDDAELTSVMAGFAALPLSPSLRDRRWASAPAEFIEKLTAYLWSVHAMDTFRGVAAAYQRGLQEAQPEPSPQVPRLCVVVIGRGATLGAHKLFSKLRPQGTYFTQVNGAGGVEALLTAAGARAKAHPEPYGHWYVDGGELNATPVYGLEIVSYERLAPLRRALLAKVGQVRDTGDGVGPESLRTLLASLTPAQLGAAGADDAIKRRFELSLLTEGSGTQIFSTTFVQWAGRELLRRARPSTLVLRYAPRQAERAMDEMLRVSDATPPTDPAGSLVDADMGAYYTWVNLQRLPGAEQASFVAWFEDGQEAFAAGPSIARGVLSQTPCSLAQVLRWAQS